MKFALLSILCATLVGVASANPKHFWKPAEKIAVERLEDAAEILIRVESPALRQPTVLGYKTAVFLATGSVDTPTRGRTQRIEVEFEGGEEAFDRAAVTVEFMGYADDSLLGERFVMRLRRSAEDGVWKITAAERAAYGRGDHR